MLSICLLILFARTLVIIFASQFVSVIGLQFLISLPSFPSLGSRVRVDSRCEGGKIPVSTLNFHELSIVFPTIGHNFL
jgi:hypothetical protein